MKDPYYSENKYVKKGSLTIQRSYVRKLYANRIVSLFIVLCVLAITAAGVYYWVDKGAWIDGQYTPYTVNDLGYREGDIVVFHKDANLVSKILNKLAIGDYSLGEIITSPSGVYEQSSKKYVVLDANTVIVKCIDGSCYKDAKYKLELKDIIGKIK